MKMKKLILAVMGLALASSNAFADLPNFISDIYNLQLVPSGALNIGNASDFAVYLVPKNLTSEVKLSPNQVNQIKSGYSIQLYCNSGTWANPSTHKLIGSAPNPANDASATPAPGGSAPNPANDASATQAPPAGGPLPTCNVYLVPRIY
jgi:hypothetical protein